MTTGYPPGEGPSRPPLPPGAPVPPPGYSAGAAGGQPSAGTEPSRTRPFSNKQIAAAVLALLAIVFMVENTRTVTVRLIIPEVTLPLFAVILVCLLAGAAVALLLTWRHQRDVQRRQAQRLRRR